MLRNRWLVAMVAPCLVACGDDGGSGGGDGKPSAYYGQLAGITAEVDEANTAADRELNDAAPTTDPAELGNLFSEATLASADRLEDSLAEMVALTPPDEAESAHEELTAATGAELEQSRSLAEDLAGLDQAGLEAYQPPPGLAVAEARTDAACAVVQDLADAAGAEVEVCVGMFAEPSAG
jgi:hypothetical protein